MLHEEEIEVRGDSGYLGIEKELPKNIVPKINKRLSSIRKLKDEKQKESELLEHKNKCSIRAVVEHAFCIIKSVFGFRKTRYKGEYKNSMKMSMLYASVNLYKLKQKGYSQDWYAQSSK